MKMKTITLAVALACAGSAHAEDAMLSTVTVTASPIIEENRIDAFSSMAAVVSADQMRDQNAVDLPSALRNTPGVEISRYDQVGSYNGNQGGAVYIRGMGASRPGSEIKTYVDGVPVYMGVWSHPLLDLLPINAMQSITVYKSPQPQINGNDFASVNLETKHATRDGIYGYGRVSGGSYGTVIEQADLEGRSGKFDFMLAQGYAKSNGHRPNSDGNLNNVMGRAGFNLNDNWGIGASFLSVNNTSRDPGSNLVAPPAIAPKDDSVTNMLTAFVTHQHGDSRGELRVYNNRGKNDLSNDTIWGTFATNFSMSGLLWMEQFSPWTGGTVVAGVDQDKVSGDVNGPATGGVQTIPEFRVTSPHVALSQNVELSKDWTLVPSAGIRTYSHSQYPSESAPHVGVSLVSDRVTLFANASRGINYPGLDAPALQAAVAGMFAGTSWKQLSAEVLDHREIGAKLLATQATQVDISLFRDEVKSRYINDFGNFGAATFKNLGTYRTSGAELSVKQQLVDNWKAFGALTLLNSSLDTLPYAPKTAVTAGVNGQIGAVRVAADAQYQSRMYAQSLDRNINNPNTLQVGSFAVVNARLSYPLAALGRNGEVFVAAENLFNRTYAYTPGYPMPGRSGQLGASASF